MILFECDYTEGACPEIIKRLEETNFLQTPGYGEDEFSESAREKIRRLCGRKDADVHFLVGGTQTNFTVISSILRPYQGVLCAETGHINVHETGAVEATGHKVLALPSKDGKITAKQVRDSHEFHWKDANHEHIVQPGMVYISHPTENGTLYSKSELEELYAVCKELELPLFLDGARLGYGLMSDASTMTLQDVAENTDVFYIGGTKCGALFGEALIITAQDLKYRFKAYMKQNGAVLAKGWLMGLQFATMLESGEYFEAAKRADALAMQIKKAFEDKGVPFAVESFTNQQFVILTEQQKQELAQKYYFEDEGDTQRFCTSWATTEDEVDMLVTDIEKL